MQNKKINFWFTFVELIIITTIIIILATIGFVSYTWYIAWVRDSNRITQLSSMRDGLEMIKSTWNLPLPEDSVQVVASGIQMWYQWYAGDSTLSRIDFKEGGKDPKDKTYYSYYVTKDKKYFQLMTFLEDKETNTTFIPSVYALDYSKRIPQVTWNNLWILTDTINTPIQEILSIKSTWIIDIVSAWSSYIAHISNNEKIIWDGTVLKQSIPNKSCKRLQEIWAGNGDGIYKINPSGSTEIEVYCDMTTNGWWWTLVHKTTNNETNLIWNLDTTEWYANWDADNEYRLSINYWKDLSTEAIMAKNIRIDGVDWDDITDATISSISVSWISLSKTDPYYIFNVDGVSSSSTTTFNNTYYWKNSSNKRYVNNNDSTNYWTINQPMIYASATSYVWSALEGAWGSEDLNRHVLAKMGIFIK